ncbi:MAG: hypothetical protein P8Z73_11055 [Desulfobacteraceae bacterium]|jgi:hypothetical protein
MRLKILAAVFIGTLALAAGCPAQQGPGRPEGPAGSLRPVIYPPENLNKFPQEQVIKKELRVTTKWQTIAFEKPLQINRRGTMGLHLVVDQAPYISTMDDSPLNPECNKPECAIDAFCLRRLNDGALVRPQAVLVGDNGEEVKVRPTGHLYPIFDQHVITMALRTFKDVDSPPPAFPAGIKTITAMRIRSTTPFLVRYLWWSVDSHPELYSR